MLALTDTQLGMLAIAATAVAPEQRAAWLKEIAAKLDPPKAVIDRRERSRRARAADDEAACSFMQTLARRRRHPVQLQSKRSRWGGRLSNIRLLLGQSAFTPENFTTLAHLSVSSATSSPKSAGDAAWMRNPRLRLDFWPSETRIDLPVEYLDDLSRDILGPANAEPVCQTHQPTRTPARPPAPPPFAP